MNKQLPFLLLLTGNIFFSVAQAQNAKAVENKTPENKKATGYEIKVHIKNTTDNVCFLTKYTWDKPYLVDTAVVDNTGTMTFTGKHKLEKGVYSLYSAKKGALYFDFIVTDNQKIFFEADTSDYYKSLKISGPKENQEFHDYALYMGEKNKERMSFERDVKMRKDPDSTKLIREKNTELYEKIKKYQTNYLTQNPGNYLSTIIRLQSEPNVPEPPKDLTVKKELWQYNYYKSHYWDGIPFNDYGTLNTNRIFADKFKKYFEQVLLQHPDTVIAEADRLIRATDPNPDMFKFVTHNITVSAENSKVVGMDAVFVHMINKYFRTGKATWVDEKNLQKMIDRSDILEPILIGKISPDLLVMDTTGTKVIKKLGIDTITNSDRLTKAYYQNIQSIQKLQFNLHSIKAKYTVLIFWDVDCGHCKKEIPVVLDAYHKLKKEGVDVEVLAVYNHSEFDKWRKYIIENKLDWINMAEGVPVNNLTKRFDIYSTPVIYILDRNKVIKFKRIGGEQVEEVIRMLEKEKPNK